MFYPPRTGASGRGAAGLLSCRQGSVQGIIMAPSDYQKLIDGPTWAFIRETERWYPPDAVGLTIEGQREVYDRMCAAFRQPRPEGLMVEDRAMGGVPCRIYTPNGARQTMMYFHGGGFVVGGLDSHDDVCAEMAVATGFRVVSADYRLCPEHVHPAAFDDCLAATRATAADYGGALILAGDSAGGALAASVAHALRGELALNGMLLIYPGLGGDRTTGSYQTHAEAPMLTLADTEYYEKIRHGGTPPAADPTASALRDTDFSGLPPVVAFAAECDPLADDPFTYAAKVRAAGGEAEALLDDGLVHGWLRGRHSVPRARAAFDRILARLKALA